VTVTNDPSAGKPPVLSWVRWRLLVGVAALSAVIGAGAATVVTLAVADGGAAGPRGIRGSVGPEGPSGAVGSKGPAGPRGLQGLPGPRGPQGPSGIASQSNPCVFPYTPHEIEIDVPDAAGGTRAYTVLGCG
jgi:hypothetical protein